MKSPRRARSDSVSVAVEAAQAVALGDIPVPAHLALDEADMPHWQAITRSRSREEWGEVDLCIAAQLARCQRSIEVSQRSLDIEGEIVGECKINPRFRVLDGLVARSVSLTRLLRLQPAANQSALADLQGRRMAERAAREVRAEIDGNDLLA